MQKSSQKLQFFQKWIVQGKSDLRIIWKNSKKNVRPYALSYCISYPSLVFISGQQNANPALLMRMSILSRISPSCSAHSLTLARLARSSLWQMTSPFVSSRSHLLPASYSKADRAGRLAPTQSPASRISPPRPAPRRRGPYLPCCLTSRPLSALHCPVATAGLWTQHRLETMPRAS